MSQDSKYMTSQIFLWLRGHEIVAKQKLPTWFGVVGCVPGSACVRRESRSRTLKRYDKKNPLVSKCFPLIMTLFDTLLWFKTTSSCPISKYLHNYESRPDTHHFRTVKVHSHERQRLCLRVRLRQDDNMCQWGCCIKCKEWVLHPFFVFDTTSS